MDRGDAVFTFHKGTPPHTHNTMTTTTDTLQTAEVQELTDEQLEQVNGGFFWFFIPMISKIVTVAAKAIAGHFASQGSTKSAKALGASDDVAEAIGMGVDVAGEGVGLL